jgi:hypothetical protein
MDSPPKPLRNESRQTVLSPGSVAGAVVANQNLVLAVVEEAHRARSTSIQAQGGTQRPPSTCFFSCWTGATLWLLNAQVDDSHSSSRTSKAADRAG